MHLSRYTIATLLAIFFHTSAIAQEDSCEIKISLLTCSPGDELYSIFGHSAYRVIDRLAQTDIIFNYGTFDFEDPDFYIKFVRGKPLYFVSRQRFKDFIYSYNLENRSIIEQELDLTCIEKHKLYEALQVNAIEENKYYHYQFFFNNCSTRLRDILGMNTEDSVAFKRILPYPAPTFRELIHVYLDAGAQHWSKFGIDLLLASRIDRGVKNEEAMFLPDYLMKGFDSAVLRNTTVIAAKKTILPSERNVPGKEEGFVVTPITVTILLLLIGIAVTFLKSQRARDIFDSGYFFILGFAGCFMLFMWFGTDHDLCRDNYNLLWALPTHSIVAFMLSRDNPFIKKYFLFTSILAFALLLTWPFFPQGMNAAFFPLILLAGIRSIYRARKR